MSEQSDKDANEPTAAPPVEIIEAPEALRDDESEADPVEYTEEVSISRSQSGEPSLPEISVPEISVVDLDGPGLDGNERDLPAPPAHHDEDDVRSESGAFESVSLDDRSRAATPAPAPAPAVVPKPAAAQQAPAPSVETSTPSEPSISSPPANRPRSGTLPNQSDGRPPLLSGVLIVTSLETLASSKEARKSPAIREASEKALAVLRAGTVDSQTMRVVFEPLRLACETKSYPLVIAALDCIGKLTSHATHALAAASSGDSDSSSGSRRSSVDMNVSSEAAGPVLASDPILADEIVNTVCSCFIESTGSSLPTSSSSSAAQASTGPEAVNLHILSALLALILSSALPVHQSALLKAVRTVYNIFLLSRGHQNQMVAQAALGQIVSAVFGRVKLGGPVPIRLEGSTDSPRTDSRASARSSVVDFSEIATPTNEKAVNGLGLGDVEKTETPTDTRPRSGTVTAANGTTPVDEKAKEALQADNAPTEQTAESTPRPDATPKPAQPAQLNGHAEPAQEAPVSLRAMESRRSLDGDDADRNAPPLSEDELLVKDAFLVFRTLCKLSERPLNVESERDNRSHLMRSKLLALQLILTVLHSHMALFNDPSVLIYSSTTRERTTFVDALKHHLCRSISRNAVSSVINVFELSCEIFWRVLSGMRSKLKKEIEVLLNEIFLPILEIRTSTVRQKSILLGIMGRLCHDPQALVEIYINYDCDRASLDNVYERLMNIVSKMGTTQYTTTTMPPAPGTEPSLVLADGTPTFITSGSTPGQPTSPNPATQTDGALPANAPYEIRLQRQALEALVAVLRSLVDWAGKAPSAQPALSGGPSSVELGPNESTTSLGRSSEDGGSRPMGSSSMSSQPSVSQSQTTARTSISGTSTPEPSDDPSRFENAKQRKTTLLEGIRKFNFKPKRGINFLIEQGFIKSRSPVDIARFLLHNDGLSKAMIGEYLGEGDEENIATMHAFVDQMDFTNARFVDAVRSFLQSFRLPGEAQKIDRFMLKFADRYVAGNPTAFATADTAYVLAYSVIMLNTDLYNPQNKKRMTKPQFLKNNSGIDEGKDLPEALLMDIYDEIATNEIRMKDEIELPTGPAASGLASALSNVGRDYQREAYNLQSEGMVSKTEALFRNMARSQRRGNATSRVEQFFAASHFEHVRPMFTTAWMPILAGISDPLQNSDDMDMVQLGLEGFRQAITIVCLFDLELERNAFVTTLAKFSFLNNLSEMRPKNVEAIKTLLGIASVNGNYLKTSWKEIITCVSQLERMQLLSQGVDTRPDLGRKQTSSRSSSSRSKLSRPTEEVASAAQSRHITIAADRIFSASNSLSGTAIVDFVKALSEVSWEEIQASGLTDHPRTFCLQKLVESSYYNMDRIRLEWNNIWAIMGEHLNQVCCHSNVKVSFFALDSLRQMASHFLEKEELANFKFQKDFLRPFEYAMVHNKSVDVRDMILQCFKQLIQARVANLRSGWRTMFGVFSAASKVLNERVAAQAFEIVKVLNRDYFAEIVIHGAFADLAVCITDFCKISLYQKISLHAIEMLKALVPQMLKSPDCPVTADAVSIVVNGESSTDVHPSEDVYKWWFPILFGFYDVIMNGEDLEVRKRALDYLFDTLTTHGKSFTPDFWNQIAKEVLFPIFAVLRSRADVSRFSTHEDMSVWLSTTMIQALRNLVDLFSFYFDVLSRMLDRLLDLLCECICQENDTLARIGTACLQQLLEKNVRKLSPDLWERIVSTFITLFHTTTATQLFDVRLRLPYASTGETPIEENGPVGSFAPLSPGVQDVDSTSKQLGTEVGSVTSPSAVTPMPSTERKRAFRQIIVKCVLQLLLIETAHELLQNEEVYTTIPPAELLKLMAVLDESYRFAKKFNADKELRMALWQVGFMKQLPNLLKQESSSAATLVSVLLRMYNDQRPDHLAKRGETVDAFLPLALDIVAGYISLEAETQARNIAAWTPVVAEVLHGFCCFEDATLKDNTALIYPLAVDLLAREITTEVRASLRGLLYRIGVANAMIEEPAASSTAGNDSDAEERERTIVEGTQ